MESGSRAWGFASPDSDYDVRGVFVKPLDWYLQLKSDVPDTIVEELPGDIDVSLWDLRKALLQMAKSNASFLEWLGSPIIYRDCGIIAALNELKTDCVNPADELAAIRGVLAQKEHALESDTVTPDARLADLLADRYDSVAAHPWRKHGVSSDAYAKLEQLFKRYVKNIVSENAPQ